MKKIPLLSPKPFSDFTIEEFFSYVKSLVLRKDNKESKLVPNVGIVFKAKRITIRVKRDPKAVTRDELKILADENSKDEMSLLELFLKRKVGVTYADTDVRQQSDAEFFAEKKRLKRAERDAKPRRARKRKAKSKNQLLEPGCDSQLHEKSPVHVCEETDKRE